MPIPRQVVRGKYSGEGSAVCDARLGSRAASAGRFMFEMIGCLNIDRCAIATALGVALSTQVIYPDNKFGTSCQVLEIGWET